MSQGLESRVIRFTLESTGDTCEVTCEISEDADLMLDEIDLLTFPKFSLLNRRKVLL
jgi:hypothetical protein